MGFSFETPFALLLLVPALVLTFGLYLGARRRLGAAKAPSAASPAGTRKSQKHEPGGLRRHPSLGGRRPESEGGDQCEYCDGCGVSGCRSGERQRAESGRLSRLKQRMRPEGLVRRSRQEAHGADGLLLNEKPFPDRGHLGRLDQRRHVAHRGGRSSGDFAQTIELRDGR
jgi:hypothetical protein